MLDIKNHNEYWLKTSKHDLDSADTIFISGKYDWSLFILHLSLEKLLKAVWIKHNQNPSPPFTHNLAQIAEATKLDLSNDDMLLLLEVNEFNLETRYPDFKLDFYNRCTKEFAEAYLGKVKELYTCIIKKI